MKHKNHGTHEVIYKYINTYFLDNGTYPSIRTVAEKTGISRPTVQRYLADMGRTGKIGYSSGITHTPLGEKVKGGQVAVPLLGEVSCGLPSPDEELIEEYFHLPRALVGEGPLYLLRARGDSMIGVGIHHGDLVLVRQTSEARAGQITVVMAEGEVTLKRYFPEPENNRIRLHPENPAMEDIYVSDATVQGIALKVLKDLA